MSYRILLCSLLGASLAGAAAPHLDSLSQSSGRPGAVLTALPGDFPGFMGNPFVLFKFPDGIVVPAAADVLDDGTLQFLVPYLIDTADAKGYRTGDCLIGLPLNGKRVAEIPFHIDELSSVDRPVDAFRALVNTLSAATHDELEYQRSVDGFADLVDAIEAMSATRLAQLLALADGIEQNGSATMPLDLLNPNPDQGINVTLRDLQQLTSMVADLGPLTQQNMWRKHRARRLQKRLAADSSAGCIADAFGPHPNAWDSCLDPIDHTSGSGVGAIDVGQALQRLFERVLGYGSPRALAYGNTPKLTGPCKISAQGISPALVATLLLNIMNEPFVLCKLFPVKPVSITARPRPDPIPVGPASSTGNAGTQLILRTEPWWTPDFAVDVFLKRAYDSVSFDTLAETDLDCHDQALIDYTRLSDQMFQSARGIVIDALTKVQAAQPAFREVPVYKCDIDDLYPENPQGLNRNPSLDDDSALRWGLEGVSPGAYRLRFNPVYGNWPYGMFAPDVAGDPCNSPPATKFFLTVREEYQRLPRCASVTVEGGETAVKIRSAYVFTYQNDGPKNPVLYSPPRLIDTFLTLEESSFSSKASAQIKKVNDNNWQIIQSLNGAPVPAEKDVTTTWNRLDLDLVHRPGPRKIRLSVKADISGTCTGLEVDFGNVTNEVDGINGCTLDVTLDQLSPTGGATVSLSISATVLGGRGTSFGSGSGKIITDIQFLPESQ